MPRCWWRPFWWLGLSEQLDAPLLTADARLGRAPGLRRVVELAEA